MVHSEGKRVCSLRFTDLRLAVAVGSERRKKRKKKKKSYLLYFTVRCLFTSLDCVRVSKYMAHDAAEG